MSDIESKGPKPPYLSFVTLTNFLKGLGEGVIPSQIDKSLMPGQSGATQSYLLSTLLFFGLMDSKGKPSAELAELVEAKVTGDTARPIWKRLFFRCYVPILDGLNIETATTMQLQEKFKVFDYGGDTLRKCHLFFLAVVDASGLTVAKHLRNVGKVSAVRKSPKRVAAQETDPSATGGSDDDDSNQFPELEGHSIAQLPLNASGERLVRLQAPTTVTTVELKRIQQWLSFQLIVEGAAE